MTHQTRAGSARSPAARSAATHRERPHCPAWSGAPPTAAEFPINPLGGGGGTSVRVLAVVSGGTVSTTRRGPCRPVSRLANRASLGEVVTSTRLTELWRPATSEVTSTAFHDQALSGPEPTNRGE